MLFRCARASAGMVGSGFPSSANSVIDGLFEKASAGNLLSKLNPISRTLNSVKVSIAAEGNSGKRLFRRLKELNVVFIPAKASSFRETIIFRSKFSAVRESNPSKVRLASGPGSSLILF